MECFPRETWSPVQLLDIVLVIRMFNFLLEMATILGVRDFPVSRCNMQTLLCSPPAQLRAGTGYIFLSFLYTFGPELNPKLTIFLAKAATFVVITRPLFPKLLRRFIIISRLHILGSAIAFPRSCKANGGLTPYQSAPEKQLKLMPDHQRGQPPPSLSQLCAAATSPSIFNPPSAPPYIGNGTIPICAAVGWLFAPPAPAVTLALLPLSSLAFLACVFKCRFN
jgi:hypothetical protein